MQEMDSGSENDSEPDAGAQNDPEDGNWGSTARRGRRKKKKVSEAEQATIDNGIPCALSDRDPPNFLKLCRAIQLFTLRELSESELVEADNLIRTYCTELIEVSVQPSHRQIN